MNVQEDHIHIILSTSPRLPVSEVMGIQKGKTAKKIQKFSYSQEEAQISKSTLE